MSLPRYRKYKSSGADWLGAVPDHWDVQRLKTRFVLRTEKAGRRDNCIALENVEGWTGRFMATGSEFEGEGVAFDRGDLLFGKLRPYLAKVFLAEDPGEAVGDFHVLHPAANVDGRYAQYQMLNRSFIEVVDGSTFGSKMPRAGWEALGGMPFVFPPQPEQTAIADFLDHETAKIDVLIAEQERLIVILSEKRQATISYAVTRGLDSSVPTQASGSTFFSDVPKHWQVVRLKSVASVQTGIAKGKDVTGKRTISVPYLRVANVQDGFLALDDVATIEIERELFARYRLAYGDVLMNEGGDFDKLGRGAIWRDEVPDCIHQNHVFAVRPQGITPGWLNRIISTHYAQFHFMTRSKQSTNLASISSYNIKELPVPLPPATEQEEILEFIEREAKKLDALNDESKRAIALLKERRSALIAAAVTGQIDVCGAIPQPTVEVELAA